MGALSEYQIGPTTKTKLICLRFLSASRLCALQGVGLQFVLDTSTAFILKQVKMKP